MSNVFDDLITSAKNLVDIAGKKTDNVVEVSKLKYQYVQMTSELKALYENGFDIKSRILPFRNRKA